MVKVIASLISSQKGKNIVNIVVSVGCEGGQCLSSADAITTQGDTPILVHNKTMTHTSQLIQLMLSNQN